MNESPADELPTGHASAAMRDGWSPDASGTDHAAPDASPGLRPSDWIKTRGSAASKWLGMTIGLVAGGALALGLIGFGLTRWSNEPKRIPYDRVADPTSAIIEESAEEPNANASKELADGAPGIRHIDPAPASDDRIATRGPPQGDAGSDSPTGGESIAVLPSTNKLVERPNADDVLPPDFQSHNDTKGQRLEKPNSFADLASLLEGPAVATIPAEPAATSAEDADESSPPLGGTVASVASRSRRSDIARTMDVSARLGAKVRAVHFDKVPLIDVVRSAMRLSGTSMQIDPAALRQTGNDAESVVTYSASDVSLDQLLRQALQPLNLRPVIEGQIVRISSPFWEESQLSQMSFFIGDLLKGKGSDLDLASVISKLIEPDSWSDVGGPGSIRASGELLKVSQTRRVQFQVLILLEKLRLARGLRPQSRIPARYVLLASRWAQLHQLLAKPIDMNAWHPQPFLDVVIQLEEASDLRILVDWQALARVDWRHDSACSLVARKTSVEEVFDQLLAPRELELRPISDDTVQITSASANAARPYLEFYSLEELGESGLARLEASMNTRVGSFALDTASDTALVVLPASGHRALLGR